MVHHQFAQEAPSWAVSEDPNLISDPARCGASIVQRSKAIAVLAATTEAGTNVLPLKFVVSCGKQQALEDKQPVIRVVENEWGASLYAQAATALPTRRSMSATLWTSAMPGFGVSSGSGFAGAGRVYIARLFILSSFLSRRQPEGH
jgi:hypothetical protein